MERWPCPLRQAWNRRIRTGSAATADARCAVRGADSKSVCPVTGVSVPGGVENHLRFRRRRRRRGRWRLVKGGGATNDTRATEVGA